LNKMKWIGLLVVALIISIGMQSVYAERLIQFEAYEVILKNDGTVEELDVPVTDFGAYGFVCTKNCNDYSKMLYDGERIYSDPDANNIVVTYPTNLQSPHGYGHVFHKDDYVIYEVTANFAGNSHGVPEEPPYTIYFGKMEMCRAPIDSVQVINDVAPHEPIQIEVSTSVDASVWSPFLSGGPIKFEAPQIPQSYKAEVLAVIEIRDENNQLVHTDQQTIYIEDSGVERVFFTYIPDTVGKYTVRAYTQVPDARCLADEVVQAYKTFNVVSDIAESCYANANNLNAQPLDQQAGKPVIIGIETLSNAVDAGELFTPLPVQLTYTLSKDDYLYSFTKTVDASTQPDMYLTILEEVTFPEEGIYNVQVDVLGFGCPYNENYGDSLTIEYRVLASTPGDDNTPPVLNAPNVFIDENSGFSDNIIHLPDYAYDADQDTDPDQLPENLDYVIIEQSHPQKVFCEIDNDNNLDCEVFVSEIGESQVQIDVVDKFGDAGTDIVVVTIRDLPACSDGIDNDNDGRVDADDPGCLSADDNNEEGTLFCSETDGGFAPDTKGNLQLYEEDELIFGRVDTCTNDNVLTEFLCDNIDYQDGQVMDQAVQVSCAFGCANGACQPEPQQLETNIQCFPNVIIDNEQVCSVHVTAENEPVADAQVTVFFTNGDAMGTCTTQALSGGCQVRTTADMIGVFEVYAQAQKNGFYADLDTHPTYQYRVLDQRYDIVNLKVYNDPQFTQEDYTFFRNENLYIRFEVVDTFGGNDVDDLISEATLVSPPGGHADLTEIDNQNGVYYFALTPIPPTHDFLGESQVFTFVIDYQDGSGGQAFVNLNILNNPPQIIDTIPDITLRVNEHRTLDLTPFGYDIEDADLSWSAQGLLTGIATAEVNNNILHVQALALGTDTLTLTVADLNEDTASQTITVQVTQQTQCADGLDNDNDGRIDLDDPGCLNADDNSEEGQLYCSDTDGGFTPEVKGNLKLYEENELIFARVDVCTNDNQLTEFLCDNIGYQDGQVLNQAVQVSCAFGCVNGACLSNDIPACADGLDNDNDGRIDLDDPGCLNADDSNEEGQLYCSDTDGGFTPEVKGNLKLYEENELIFARVDVCTNDNQLTEFLCDNIGYQDGQVLNQAVQVSCAYGCADGQCAGEPLPQCSDGMDNDGDGLIDLDDPGCSHARDNDESDDPVEENNLHITRINVIDPEMFLDGLDGTVSLWLDNSGGETYDNTRIQVFIPELGVKGSAGPFELKRGRTMQKTVQLPVYEPIEPGYYTLRISIWSEQVKRIKHREVLVQ
jgi:hypothetical protein